MHVDDVGLRVEMVFPHVFEEHRAGYDLSRVAHQVFEQLELAPLQLDRPTVAHDPERQQVDAQIGDGQHGLDRGVAPAPRQRLEPGQELAKGKGLGQVVVAPGAQPADAVVDLGEGAQNQDRRLVAGLAQRLDDAEPVDAARQHAIEDQGVVPPRGGESERVAAVIGVVDRMPFLGQPLTDESSDAFRCPRPARPSSPPRPAASRVTNHSSWRAGPRASAADRQARRKTRRNRLKTWRGKWPPELTRPD